MHLKNILRCHLIKMFDWRIETLYEEPQFKERRLAALVASKVIIKTYFDSVPKHQLLQFSPYHCRSILKLLF